MPLQVVKIPPICSLYTTRQSLFTFSYGLDRSFCKSRTPPTTRRHLMDLSLDVQWFTRSKSPVAKSNLFS